MPSSPITCPQVWTLAGQKTQYGLQDGRESLFQFPTRLITGQHCEIIVADTDNHCIRKVNPDGMVVTIAGNGEAGCQDGLAEAAQFNRPQGLAMDADGNILVADTYNHRIRKISPQGLVTTVAGNGLQGYADGPSADAMFDSPVALAVKPDGAILVADFYNHLIRMVKPNGAVCTIAGTGDAGFLDGDVHSALFSRPSSIVIDDQGRVIVADYGNHCLRMIHDGQVTKFCGTGSEGYTDGRPSIAEFKSPWDISMDGDGNFIVVDLSNVALRYVTKEGNVSRVPGAPKPDDHVSCFHIARATSAAVNRRGHLVVASRGDHCVYVVRTTLKPLTVVGFQTKLDDVADRGLKLLKSGIYSDITFLVEGQRLHAHRCILATCSPVFQKMFDCPFQEGNCRELELPDTQASSFNAFLELVYCGVMCYDETIAIPVMQLCHQYQVQEGYERCLAHCKKHMDPLNAVLWLVESHAMGLHDMKSYALEYVLQEFKSIKTMAPDSVYLLKDHGDLATEILAIASCLC